MEKKLILATRNDGLGERLRAVLNALYIKEKLGFDFGFVWQPLKASATEISQNKLAPIVVPPQEEIFSQNFIKKYSFNGIFEDATDEFGRFKRKKFQNLLTTKPLNPPYRATQKRLDTIFSDIDEKEYKMSLIKIWQGLDFSEKVKQILAKAKQKVQELGSFAVLHIRAGDAIFAKNSQKCITSASIYSRALAFPLAIEIIKQILSKNLKLIVFSDDLSLLECFKTHLPNLLKLSESQKEKLLFSSEFSEQATGGGAFLQGFVRKCLDVLGGENLLHKDFRLCKFGGFDGCLQARF